MRLIKMMAFYLAGSTILTAWTVVGFIFLRKPLRDYLYRRAYRRDSRSHPGQVCNQCGGHATRLVQQGSYPHKTVYVCKDQKTCAKTVLYERSLMS